MITEQELKELYEKYSDQKIIDIAKNSRGLRKDSIILLKKEIEKRKLDIRFSKKAEAENYEFSLEEKTMLIERMKSLKCPYCQLNSNLNGIEIVNTGSSNVISISCEVCFKSNNLSSIFSNIIQSLLPPRNIIGLPFNLISIFWNHFNYGNYDNNFFEYLFEERKGYLATNKKSDLRLQVLLNRMKVN